MFDGLTAWFSLSVNDSTKKLWSDFGGVETNFDTADFIFSDDNTCPDTERVFSSTAYEKEHLAVFHSRYITACVAAGDCEQVILGEYYLPPQEILHLVRQQVTLAWDDSGPQHKPRKQPSKRKVVISPAHRPGNTQGSPAPGNPAQGRQVNQQRRNHQTTATAPQSTGPTTRTQPASDTGHRYTSASASEQADRSDGLASNQQSIRSLENRTTQLSVGASTSRLNQRRKEQRVAERQSEQQRTGSIRQQNQSSEMSPSAKRVIHQKRVGVVSTPAHSPSKKRNMIQRSTEQSDSHRERERGKPPPRSDNPRARQTDSNYGQSAQQTSITQRRNATEVNSRTTAEGNSNPRRRGVTAASRASPQHVSRRNDIEREVKQLSSAVVVSVDVCATDGDRSALNPQPVTNRSNGHAECRDRTSGHTDMGVCHISQLKKMPAEFTDFHPKKNGAEVCRKATP